LYPESYGNQQGYDYRSNEDRLKESENFGFRLHDFRHIAQTNWARRKVHVDAAMLAAGHAGVQMHKRYVNLKADDVAEAFGLENGNMSGR
jgi:integrase